MIHRALARRLLCALCLITLTIASSALTGCASYVTPGRGADMAAFGVRKDENTDASIVQALGKQPLAQFPTGVAVARVQSPGYASESARGWGTGRYSIVTTRDVETDEQIKRLASLPLVSGIAPINRLQLPNELKTDLELRQAAAGLHADILLVYTLDTTFNVEDNLQPLSVLTLGLSPNQHARVLCTASAVLIDTRNGFLYGTVEATESGSQLTSAWTSTAAVDDTRKRTESAAFEKLVGQLETTWGNIVRTYAAPAGATRPPVSRAD